MNKRDQQNALYAALKPHLGQEQSLQALLIWQQDYAGDGDFSPRYFADLAARISGNRVAPKVLLMSLVAELSERQKPHTDISDTLNDFRSRYVSLSGDTQLLQLKQRLGLMQSGPFLPPGNRAKTASSSSAFRLPEVSAFSVLIEKILSLCDKHLAESLRLDLLKALKPLRISAPLSSALSLWLGDACRNPLSLQRVETEELRTVVSAVYGVLCHHLGPVKADQLLATALHRLESNGGAIYTGIFKSLL